MFGVTPQCLFAIWLHFTWKHCVISPGMHWNIPSHTCRWLSCTSRTFETSLVRASDNFCLATTFHCSAAQPLAFSEAEMREIFQCEMLWTRSLNVSWTQFWKTFRSAFNNYSRLSLPWTPLCTRHFVHLKQSHKYLWVWLNNYSWRSKGKETQKKLYLKDKAQFLTFSRKCKQ